VHQIARSYLNDITIDVIILHCYSAIKTEIEKFSTTIRALSFAVVAGDEIAHN